MLQTMQDIQVILFLLHGFLLTNSKHIKWPRIRLHVIWNVVYIFNVKCLINIKLDIKNFQSFYVAWNLRFCITEIYKMLKKIFPRARTLSKNDTIVKRIKLALRNVQECRWTIVVASFGMRVELFARFARTVLCFVNIHEARHYVSAHCTTSFGFLWFASIDINKIIQICRFNKHGVKIDMQKN